MITAVLEYQGNTLVVELPCRLYELQEHLFSIGITWQISSLPVSGTGHIRVKLEADEPVGEMVLSQMECADLFLELNGVCQEIQKVCLYGYDEFLDMLSPKDDPASDHYLFYREYESAPPSTATGFRYLEEETGRCRTTMENYQRACRMEEGEEAEETGDEWEDGR